MLSHKSLKSDEEYSDNMRYDRLSGSTSNSKIVNNWVYAWTSSLLNSVWVTKWCKIIKSSRYDAHPMGVLISALNALSTL